MSKTLTLGEMSAVEDESGLPFSAIGNPDKPQARLYAAIVMVVKKRTDSTFNMARAFETPTDELEAIVTEFTGNGPKASSEKTD